MGSRRKLGLVGLAGLLACLPGRLHAQHAVPDTGSRIYTIHIPSSGPLSKVELYAPGASSAVGGWEVTVAVDAARCEIYCTYRRTPDAFGRMLLAGLLLPPITTIRVYTDSESRPTTVFVDPAGLGFPAAANHVPVPQEKLYLAGRRLYTTVLVRDAAEWAPSSPQAHSISSIDNAATPFPTALPLRL